MFVEIQAATPALDTIVWGAAAIAPHVGRSVSGTYHALESGEVPGSKKIAGRWALNVRAFYAAFDSKAA